jgi:hypothetical protein
MKKSVLCRLALAGAVVVCAAPAVATDLQLTIKDGRVTLVADNVTVRTILEEWATVGDSTVVNAAKLTGLPLTLRLEGVSEREALDAILRSAAGYVAAPRPAGQGGASRFDRIVVLAASKAPPAPARSMSAPAPAPFAPPPVTEDVYEPDEWPPDDPNAMPPQLQPYPGPFPGTAPPQQEQDAPAQPQTSPRPGFLPAPAQPQAPVLTLPPGYPGAPTAVPPRKPGGGRGGR